MVPIRSAPFRALYHREVRWVLAPDDLRLVYPLEIGTVEIPVATFSLMRYWCRRPAGTGSRSTICPVITAPSERVSCATLLRPEESHPVDR